MMIETQFTDVLIISFVGLNLTLTVTTLAMGIRTKVLMRKADRALYDQLHSYREWFRSREEQQALLHQMFERDPRIEPLYAATSRWGKRTIILGWLLTFVLFVMLSLVYNAVIHRLGIN